MILVKHYQNQKRKKPIKILLNLGKLSNLFGDLKSMTNYLPFETNRRVLAQLVEKCQVVKHSYFQVQEKVKKQKKRHGQKLLVNFKEMWSLNKLSNCHEILHAKSADQDLFRSFFRNRFDGLEAEICRFFMLQLTWDTL